MEPPVFLSLLNSDKHVRNDLYISRSLLQEKDGSYDLGDPSDLSSMVVSVMSSILTTATGYKLGIYISH